MNHDELSDLAKQLATDAFLNLRQRVETEEQRRFGMAVMLNRIVEHLGMSLQSEVQIMHHLNGRWPTAEPPPWETYQDTPSVEYWTMVAFGRWIIVKPDNHALAWTGSTWAPHKNGFPAGEAQICNFDSRREAVDYAERNPLLAGK